MGLPSVVALGVLLAAGTERTPPENPRALVRTPAYVPRAAYLGGSTNGVTTPRLLVTWELDWIEGGSDALVLVGEGGAGFGIGPFPHGEAWRMRSFYQHFVGLGLGYRKEAESGLHWGLHVSTGPTFYGGRMEGLPSEARVVGMVEGKVQLGFRAGGVVLGASVGYGSPYELPVRSTVVHYLGGAWLGLFANWR